MNEVSLRDVSVRFGDVQALDGVDIAVRAGEVVMLAGPNGAGKSTLLKVLLGLVRPAHGQLRIDGQESGVDNDFKRRFGYLPEAAAFAGNLSGRDVLRFFARARGVPRRRVDEVLQTVGLSHAAKRATRGYSRGMRQRLGVGVAILHEPELLLLDEPTGGLDQEGLALLWTVLARWRDKGRLVLLSSHDLSLLERRVDRICVLQAGKVCASDTPDRLRVDAGLPVRVTFEMTVDARPLADALLGTGLCGLVQASPGRLSVEVPPSALLSVLDVRSRFDGSVDALRVEEPGLDDVYEQILRRAAPVGQA